MSILECKALTKRYGGKPALEGVELSIEPGRIVGLLGPNGSGKTTLIKLANGLLTPTSGEILIDGKAPSPETKAIVSYLPDRNALPDWMTVAQTVGYYADFYADFRRDAAQEMLARLGLDVSQRVKTLSKGTREKLQLILVMSRAAKLYLLDEPLGALDLKLRKEMQQELKYIQQEVGITFIFVTHDQEEALTMSDKIVVMNAGEIQQIGTPTEIYRYPVNEFVANFIGETNIIDGVMQGDDLVVFEDKKFPCRARGFNKNEKVDVVIRPEHLDIVPRAEGMLKGVVKSQLFKGMHYDTVVETRVGTTITVKMQVSQDRPVLNADAGEKISASAFLIDVEDVGELDDAKVVALASAEAWDVETEEPISIKNVEYDIKPEVGSYSVTFTTAAGTSITVKAAVMAENRVESKVYQEEIYAMNFFKKVEDIQESIALDTDLETWASASAWSLEDGEQVEITDVKYDFDPETIEPGVYDVTFSTEGYEYKVSTTRACEEGAEVGLIFRPEDIHVMKKEGQW